MSTLNELIQPKRENVTSIVGSLRDSDYFVDRSFQRKMIWTSKQKVKLIETILMGYPMPEIYLWAQKPDPGSGKQRYSIVDGQQRLTTIFQFINGEWPLAKAALEKANRGKEYAGEDWSSLPNELKQNIWEYRIDVREIPSSLDVETIHKIFARLNQTDKSLNPQELRNAVFHGEFIKASVDLANKLKDYGWKVFSDNDMRRMKDVDFSSQLLTYLIQGVVSTPPTAINELYDRYNDKYASRKKHFDRSVEILEDVATLFERKSVADFFSKTVHFYSIFAAVDLAKKEHLTLKSSTFSKFVKAYTNADFDNPKTSKLLMEYKKGSSYSTTGKAGRERRVYSLLDYLRDHS